MTHDEHQKKQRRGSSPSRNDEVHFTHTTGHLPSEEWKDLKWYPVSAAIPNGTESRNTLPKGNNTKG